MRQTDEAMNFEKKYWNCLENNDIEMAIKMSDFPVLLAGPQGTKLTDEIEYRKNCDSMDSAQMKVHELKNFQARELSDGVVSLIYEARYDFIPPGQTPQPMHMACASTWVKKDGQWKCSMHVETTLAAQPQHTQQPQDQQRVEQKAEQTVEQNMQSHSEREQQYEPRPQYHSADQSLEQIACRESVRRAARRMDSESAPRPFLR